jgi:hypothetical protein
MIYEEPKHITLAEAVVLFTSENADLSCIRESLVFLALNESDWSFVQEWCLRFLEHEDWTVRAVSATCLGHIARIHRTLDVARVLLKLRPLLEDSVTAGYAQTAIEDIEQFVH